MKVKILIALKSFEAKQLSKIHDDYGLSSDYADKILAYPKAKDPSGSRLVDSSGTKVPSRSKQRGFSSLASIALPKKHSNYTVLRSPHIDKKSRDQFEFKIHKQLIIISTQIQQIREKLFNLKLTNVPGIQMTVVFQTKTRLSDIKV